MWKISAVLEREIKNEGSNGTIFVNDDDLIDIMKDLGFEINNIHKTMEKYKNKI